MENADKIVIFLYIRISNISDSDIGIIYIHLDSFYKQYSVYIALPLSMHIHNLNNSEIIYAFSFVL